MLRSIYHIDGSVMTFVGSCISETGSGAALADVLPSSEVLLAQSVNVSELMAIDVCKAHLSLKTLVCSTACQEADAQEAVAVNQRLESSGEGELGKQFINARVLTTGQPAIYLRPLTPP